VFIDFTKVELIAGKGGRGSVHFRREKYEPMGGPDGGDGGRGGHIIFKADSNLHTLQDVRYRRRYKADDGTPGGGSRKTGTSTLAMYPATSIRLAEPIPVKLDSSGINV
jgi:GTP-binding protein